MHRRTALSVSAALLAAAPLLAACSGDARPGTAAVVGGERITISALQAEMRDVRDAQNRSPDAAQLIADTSGLEKYKLNSMIQSRVLDRTAENAGITITTKDLEDARKERIQQSGGTAQFEALALQKGGLAPGQIDRAIRDQLILAKLTQKYGEGKIAGPAAAAAKELGVKVNPRYGAWDPAQLTVGAATTSWIRQVTKPVAEAPAAG
ncbi:SurA N-terminal domain-containing protein [Streptomyces bambusae]|uniref:SurA N-terminal domain-containing protein n=1 Tax=Streptomyces bambusae TaxID=1550616 RepID=UPI001CFC70D1|nr:SurA N-terminal domain-containing protein [Streptomyces bambusae]MCB5166263.1 SurA N-terminal domain-containing protein [Streptomyces bambusae]